MHYEREEMGIVLFLNVDGINLNWDFEGIVFKRYM